MFSGLWNVFKDPETHPMVSGWKDLAIVLAFFLWTLVAFLVAGMPGEIHARRPGHWRTHARLSEVTGGPIPGPGDYIVRSRELEQHLKEQEVQAVKTLEKHATNAVYKISKALNADVVNLNEPYSHQTINSLLRYVATQ
jgi:hypothetical protein